jgi:hypothetical protein
MEASMRMSRTLLALGLATLAGAPVVAAQQTAALPINDAYRQVQQAQLDLQRQMLLAMVDSMPERLYRDKATPEQRDFAGQIEHAAGSMVFIATRFLKAAPPSNRPDTAAFRNTRAGLRGFVNWAYDWAGGALKAQTDRTSEVDLFGHKLPAWQVWDEIHQHTVWTAGQVVANFRKHGMAPPGFAFF